MTETQNQRSSHFLTGADSYALHRPTYPPDIATALADLCPARRLAVDVGCGTGQFSVLLGDCFDAVLGSDVSPDQIAHARPHPRVSYIVSPAEQPCTTPGSADLIVAAQAAHWFDLPAFYDTARNMGAPGAVIALVTYGVLDIADPADGRFQQFYWRDIAPYWPSERKHVEQGYRAIDFPFEEIAFPSCAIVRDWTLDQLLGYVDTWSASRQAIKAGAEILIEEFRSDMRAVWGDPERTCRITWPLTGRIGLLFAD